MVSYHKINSIKKEWIKETLAIKTIHTITEMNEDISAFEFGILVVCKKKQKKLYDDLKSRLFTF